VRTVDEHLQAVLDVVHPLADLDLTLSESHGCVLAEDVVSSAPLPAFDTAAVDGYAVRLGDLASGGGGPVVIPVVGDVAPGSSGAYSVQSGFSVRVAAGAPVPAGADAVVPLAWTDGGIAQVVIQRAPSPGDGIRRSGEDVAAGAVVLPAGAHIGSQQVALLAAIGRARVRARPRPRVVVVAIGSQYADVGTALVAGQLPDANTPALAAAAGEVGAIAYRVGAVVEETQTIVGVLEDQLIRADVVVACGGGLGAFGGSQRGALGEALTRLGTVVVDEVAMRPGGIQGFGTIGPDAIPIFTLPGDPVAAYVSYEVFVRPALRRMLGTEPITRPLVRAHAATRVPGAAGSRVYLPGRLDVHEGRYVATPVGPEGRYAVSALAAANALLVVPEDAEQIGAGEPTTVMVLERRHG
jgi:molybdopterin molybdotransferase